MTKLMNWNPTQWVLLDDERDMRGMIEAVEGGYFASAYDSEGNGHLVLSGTTPPGFHWDDLVAAQTAVVKRAQELLDKEPKETK